MLFGKPATMPTRETALRGRPDRPYVVPTRHLALHTPLEGPFPAEMEIAHFGMGCFWGAERAFWRLDGVYSTAVGYAGGFTPNPTYEETCTGRTGHTEAVQVVFDPGKISYEQLLKVFWEAHDPTQGYRQGNDRGTVYRSAIYATTEAQLTLARTTKAAYEAELGKSGFGPITTEIAPASTFYYAESEHQQYLYRVPNGYCSMTGTGVSCAVGTGVETA